MKLVVLLLTITSLQLSAKSYAQQVTLRVNNTSLGEVFEQIYEQTGYQFVATKGMLSEAHPVSLNVKDAPLKEVLNSCFQDQPLTYLLKDKVIIIKQKVSSETKKPESFLPPPVHIIKGTVTDSVTGKPLAGVTIQVRGSTIGTTTDNKGNFSLDAPDDAVLIISYLGYAKGNKYKRENNALCAIVFHFYISEPIGGSGIWNTEKSGCYCCYLLG